MKSGRVRLLDVNLEAEHSLLGCILTKGDLIKEIMLEDKHFHEKSNRTLYKVLCQIDKDGDPIDLVTVITKLGHSNLQRIGGKAHLSKLINSVASLEPYKTYEKLILDAWRIREARRIQEIEIHSLDDLSKVMNDYSNLELANNDEDYDHQKALRNLYNQIENQQSGLSGLDTGFRDLNKFLDGFQKGDLIISAARPSVGKTAKMLKHAIAHCRNGGITVIFSLEMGDESLNKRLLSAIGHIDGYKMKNPNEYFNDKDWGNYAKAMGELGNMNLHIYDKSGQTIPYIRSKVKKLRRKYPDVPMLVQIDYLQLIRSGKRTENRNIEVGEITRSLKELAKDMNVPVYLLSQLSRGVESRQDKRPMMSDIRDSGSVEQDADVIEFLYRDDYYNAESENKNIIEVIIAKQRNGPVGTVELAFIKEYNLFVDLDVSS